MDEETPSESESGASKGSQKGITTIIAVIIIILLIAGGFIVYGMNKSKAPQPTGNNGANAANTSVMQETPTAPESSPSAAQGAMAEKVIEVDGANFSFTPKTITVKKGDKVTIDFKNTQGFHNLTIDEYQVKTSTISAGKDEKVSFVADKAGTFQYYCAVANHRAMGMWGTLTVTP